MGIKERIEKALEGQPGYEVVVAGSANGKGELAIFHNNLPMAFGEGRNEDEAFKDLMEQLDRRYASISSLRHMLGKVELTQDPRVEQIQALFPDRPLNRTFEWSGEPETWRLFLSDRVYAELELADKYGVTAELFVDGVVVDSSYCASVETIRGNLESMLEEYAKQFTNLL